MMLSYVTTYAVVSMLRSHIDEEAGDKSGEPRTYLRYH